MARSTLKKEIGILFSRLKPYKKELTIISLLGIVSAIANGFIPFLVGKLFDALIDPASISLGSALVPAVFFFIGLWVITQIISNFIGWHIEVKQDFLRIDVYNDYMAGTLRSFIRLPLSFFIKHKTGATMRKFGTAAAALSQITGAVIIRFGPEFLSILIALIISWTINIPLTLILVTAIVIYLFILKKIVEPMAKLQEKVQKAYNHAFSVLNEAAYNAHSVKQSAAENFEIKRTDKNFKVKANQIERERDRGWIRVNFSQRILVFLTQASVFVLSIIFIRQGVLTIGQLVMFNGYAAMMFGPFVSLGYRWQTIQNGLTNLRHSEQILTMQPETYHPRDKVRAKTIKGKISFENVSFSYEKDKVLQNINFTVNPGEIIALVGESGAGKSTLIDLISGYYFAKEGKVLIDDYNIKRYDLEFLRKHIAIVPQEVLLFNDTIKRNIVYGNFNASEKEIEQAAKMAHAHEFISKFPKKYKQVVGERGIKLSVGQKQRIAIARAILRNPNVLILDEPTSALDSKSESFIQGSLEELMKGRTTFVIAHRLSTVRKADKILVLDEGRVVETGTHQELIKIPNGVYRHLYDLQIGLI